MLAKFLAMLFLLCVGFALHIAVFFYGWGLWPRNWWIVVVGVIAGTGLRAASDAVYKAKVQ